MITKSLAPELITFIRFIRLAQETTQGNVYDQLDDAILALAPALKPDDKALGRYIRMDVEMLKQAALEAETEDIGFRACIESVRDIIPTIRRVRFAQISIQIKKAKSPSLTYLVKALETLIFAIPSKDWTEYDRLVRLTDKELALMEDNTPEMRYMAADR